MKKIVKTFLFALTLTFCLTFLKVEAQTTAPTTNQPDLTISASDMKITPTTYKGGDKITLSAKVLNSGNVKATNIKVDFYFGSVKVYTKTISSLSKNGKSTINYKYSIPADFSGSVAFKAIADPDNAIVEKDENNNSAEIQVSINETKIDLAINEKDMQIAPASFKGGDKITLKTKVANLGNTKATNIKVDFYFGETKIYSKTIKSLSPNAKSNVTYKYTLPVNLAGAVAFKAVADPDNAIQESKEDNNNAEINANVNQAIIDLMVDSLKTSNAKPKVG